MNYYDIKLDHNVIISTGSCQKIRKIVYMSSYENHRYSMHTEKITKDYYSRREERDWSWDDEDGCFEGFQGY